MLYGRQLERHELHLIAHKQKLTLDFAGPSKLVGHLEAYSG